MTRHQYDIVKWLRRVWFLRWFIKDDAPQDTITKQAEIELAGQVAARHRPPLADGEWRNDAR